MTHSAPENTVPEIACLTPCRLDQILSLWLDHLSRGIWQKTILNGGIEVNNIQVCIPGYRLKPKDIVRIVDMPITGPSRLSPVVGPLDIQYEDRDILIVNKQPALVVHPFPGSREPCLVHYLLDHCQGQLANPDSNRPGILHRLDKDTSGLLIIAKTDTAHTILVRDMAERRITRIYLALAYGRLELSQRLLHFASQDPRHIRRYIVQRNGRKMITDVLPVAHHTTPQRGKARSLLACRLHTGRTHQIRLQLNAIGHPVIGDHLYGNHTRMMAPRQCLHASHITFRHPVRRHQMSFTAIPPDDFMSACHQHGFIKLDSDIVADMITSATKKLTSIESPDTTVD